MFDRRVKRRDFLKKGAALVSLGSIMPSVLLEALFAPRSSHNVANREGRVLVVLQMAGGNDGLNTVVPYTDGRYYAARPTLAIAQDKVLPLSERIGLHPALVGFKELWDAGQLAIVEGVGYPDPNRSHFRSMEIWHSANPGGISRQGWLGKYLDVTAGEQGNLWRAISFGAGLSPSLVAQVSTAPTLQNIDSYRLQNDPRHPTDAQNKLAAWRTLYSQAASEPGYIPYISATGVQAYDSALQLQKTSKEYQPEVKYPDGPLAAALRLVAQMINSDLGMSIAYVTTGGFDTHARQADTHARLLSSLSDAVLAFFKDVAAQGRAEAVTVMAWSEFGRRVNENASAGTDHGTAAPMFIIGVPVKGGTYGSPTNLSDLDNIGDPKFTTDFRSVYATVLEDWLRTPAKDILGQSFPTLGLFKSSP